MRKNYLTFLLVLSGFPLASQLWAQDSLKVNFVGLDTSLKGQNLTLYLRNPQTGVSSDSLMVMPVDTTNFMLGFDSVSPGNYFLDFYVDADGNGRFNTPPDKSWRVELDSFQGDTTINWNFDTNYVDITWPPDTSGGDTTGVDTSLFEVAINFTGFAPHVGQDLYVYVRDASNGDKLDSLAIEPVDSSDFAVVFDSVQGGKNYNIDFWADLDSSGTYNAPPVDHAWRIELMNLMGDTVVDFAHNTDFVDIFPADDTTGGSDSTLNLTINFTGFDSTVGQNFYVYLRDPQTNDFMDSTLITALDSNDFTVVFNNVTVNQNVNVDFYSDVNANGSYDAPPTDHAWRIQLTNLTADTTILFLYDTVYTDIGLGGPITGVADADGEKDFSSYPNPVQDELTVSLNKGGTGLSIYSLTGALVLHRNLTTAERLVKMNVSGLKPGMYILKFTSESGSSQKKFLKE
ncbi:MAG TPA: T9SS type A sorting domain-containing protein [Bacteroidales bacterium]|nr:T9SS type A sorting domain-containing protein [Bacteroidales bacterium]